MNEINSILTALRKQGVKIVQRGAQEHQGTAVLGGTEDWPGMQREIVECPSMGILKSGPETGCGRPWLKIWTWWTPMSFPSSHIHHHQDQTQPFVSQNPSGYGTTSSTVLLLELKLKLWLSRPALTNPCPLEQPLERSLQIHGLFIDSHALYSGWGVAKYGVKWEKLLISRKLILLKGSCIHLLLEF